MDTLIDFSWLSKLLYLGLESVIQRLYVFLDPSQGLFLGYILSALVVALLFQSYQTKSWNFIWLMKSLIQLHKLKSKSTVDDIKLYLVDKVLLGFMYSFILSSAFVVKQSVLDLLSIVGLPIIHVEVGLLLSGLLTLGAIIVFDFATFFEHYLAHKVRFLWEFHKIHHIADNLNPLTAYRSHPVNQICFVLIVSLFTGIYSGVINHLFPSEQLYIVIAGQNVFMLIFLIMGLNLQHSHVFIRYPRFVRSILVSPAYHQIHHSSLRKHHDVNFGFLFSFWDQIFNTQVMPTKQEVLTFGVAGEKYDNYAGVLNMYLTPFKRVARRMFKRHETVASSKENRVEP
ncbi:sterol desaturase family protein [Photobacterium sanctipauli]|uniref:sterol desaturase family protein n=1 Tax=Photobacterium sanctipauli TaxID=1342794 RepID=UPI0011B24E3F|nr:sterol desaturase family protein [Photobacterium sanctipauli]